MTTTTDAKLTFDALAALEPGLLRLEADIRRATHAHHRKRTACGAAMWYGWPRSPAYRFRGRMAALVGLFRGDPHPDPAADAVLRSIAAYDVAYRHLYRLRPACRNCTCL